MYILHAIMNVRQQAAIKAFKTRQNIFLTGPAGSGKTCTLREIISICHAANKNIAVTASTGLAAYLLRGRTVHSFLGIGLAQKSAKALADQVRTKAKTTYQRLLNLEILAIDEISMIDNELLDKVNEFLKLIRNNHAPFGGIQVIFSGDMAQLPPISNTFCFKSQAWKEAAIKTHELTELMRQQHDLEFQAILQDLRFGIVTPETLKKLKALKHTQFPDGIQPTRLYSLNVDVDKINAQEFDKLDTPRFTYRTKYSTHANTKAWATSLKIPEEITLAKGAQVYLTWNSSTNPALVNGTRGVITDLNTSYVTIKLTNGEEATIEYFKLASEDDPRISVAFMPLKLAYAITVHKAQGMTLDAVEIDLGTSIFEYGQAYTALSRARNLQSIRLVDIHPKSFKAHPDVIKFYEGLK